MVDIVILSNGENHLEIDAVDRTVHIREGDAEKVAKITKAEMAVVMDFAMQPDILLDQNTVGQGATTRPRKVISEMHKKLAPHSILRNKIGMGTTIDERFSGLPESPMRVGSLAIYRDLGLVHRETIVAGEDGTNVLAYEDIDLSNSEFALTMECIDSPDLCLDDAEVARRTDIKQSSVRSNLSGVGNKLGWANPIERVYDAGMRLKTEHAPMPPLSELLSAGPISSHPPSRRVFVDGEEVDLRLDRKQELVLNVLLANCGRVLSKAEIAQATDSTATSVHVSVLSLRKKLGPHGDLIQTEHGKGFYIAGHNPDAVPEIGTIEHREDPSDVEFEGAILSPSMKRLFFNGNSVRIAPAEQLLLLLFFRSGQKVYTYSDLEAGLNLQKTQLPNRIHRLNAAFKTLECGLEVRGEKDVGYEFRRVNS